MRTPQISVVLPVRNAERYISAAIESVLAQSFSDFELLIVEDQCTDGTGAIVSHLQRSDRRIKVLRNTGSGLVDALNYGVRSASAEIIARMDADDIALPTRLQRQYDFLCDHQTVAAVGTQVAFIDENGAPIRAPIRKGITVPQSPSAIARMLLKNCCMRHPSVMFRRTAFDKIGGYRKRLADAEDYDLWLRMAEDFELANLPEHLLLYRIHPGQVSEQKKWSQRLARNLALAAAEQRRITGTDPIASYGCFAESSEVQRCQGRGCATCVCQSVRAFTSATRILSTTSASLSRDEFWRTLLYLYRNTMGDGQKSRLIVLVALCQEAARRGALFGCLAALGLALALHPSRAVRLLMTRVTGSER